MKRTSKTLAILLIGLIMIGLVVAAALYTCTMPTQPTTFSSTATVTGTTTVIPATMDGSVALVDASGSMNGMPIPIIANYEDVISFADWLWQTSGNSRITTCVTQVLDWGTAERVAVVSDLESYPAEEIQSINGKYFFNRELIFFVPDNVDLYWLDTYEQMFSKAMDENTCTLKFVSLKDGRVLRAPYENYIPVVSSTTNGGTPVTVTTNYQDGAHVPENVVIWGVVIFAEVILALIIALITLSGNEKVYVTAGSTQSPVPADIDQALKHSCLLVDGSGSVSDIYDKILAYAKKCGVCEVWRFASLLERLSIDEAAQKIADGATNGWTALRDVSPYCDTVTIVSDFEFTDSKTEADGIHFKEINCVCPPDANDATINQLRCMCDKLITILLK